MSLSTRRMLVAASIALCAGAALAQQQDFSKVEIKTTKVAGNVYMLEGAGGNIGVSAGPDGLLIVDDQFAPLADKIKAALAAIDKGDLKFLLNTHWHFDHTGGNEIFGLEVADRRARERAQAALDRADDHGPQACRRWQAAGLPVITFGQDPHHPLQRRGDQGHPRAQRPHRRRLDHLLHRTPTWCTPGDDFTNGVFPFIDLGAGGSIQGVAKNAEMMLKEFPQDAKYHSRVTARWRRAPISRSSIACWSTRSRR